MFWMKNMMKSFIGMDYERGLNLLKDYVEDGEVHSQLNFLGESQYAGCNYIGIERKCSIAESPKFMEADFTKLMTYSHNTEGFRPHEAFCTYHKWDVVKGRAHYTAGVPYNQLPADVPSEFLKGKVPACKVHTVEHVGPYQHLGNAWSALISMQRNKEIKPLKKVHPFETYGNSPKDTAPNDLISRIHFPVR